MKKTLLLLTLLISVSLSFSAIVPLSDAQKAAKNFYYQMVNQVKEVSYNDLFLKLAHVQKTEAGSNLYYVFNVNENDGFIIVSAEDAAVPVIGYSFEGKYTADNLPDAYKMIMEHNEKQIRQARILGVKSTPETAGNWNDLLTYSPTKGIKDVETIEPFMLTMWNQTGYYNELCPEDAAASDGRCPVGCVAVAMAQAMKYYNYPTTGQGSNSYDYWWGWDYGTLSANFGSTTYHWNEMPFDVDNINDPVATLMYHCGVAVEMYYAPDGSGADVGTAGEKMISNFKFSNAMDHVSRDSYTETTWETLMRTEIDNRRPIIYSGSPEEGAGHAWNIDGYQGTDYFHQNYGWGGAMNGYYYLNEIIINTTSGGEPLDLTFYQDALINIMPASGYPVGCSSTLTIDGYEGNFDDGSGNQNYANNKNCSWKIQPTCGSFTFLTFDSFDLEAGDVVYVYDGLTTSAPLLAAYYGDDTPVDLVCSGNGMLINFVTNSTGTATGWTASYTTRYCLDDVVLTAASGNASDGSGVCDYQSAAYCKWILQPPYATSITIDFTYFDLADDLDYVKIYKNDISTLVVKYDTDNLPVDPITIEAGTVIIRFFSDNGINAGGWSLNYNAIISSSEEIKTASSFEVFPNPFKGDATVTCMMNEPGLVNISVTNIIGETLGSFNGQQPEGEFRTNLSDIAPELQAGLYFVNLSVNGKVTTKKVICY
ncbi:MAG: hypothetical protein A2W91_14265 [Bacteroidetes bacterium GWF2_38_335]|nr:MAG: hypothetical protein A2W91_14265 [Bacteroidetes bacterium GWF2_38_335]OFY79373.1 MAG: hypothetical protein A2281_16890 [Bacteroidetes bacterium RIFOXYA12_FULL_38_20]HBS85636.1 hypothetical protein [Bacteroidales bacterium]